MLKNIKKGIYLGVGIASIAKKEVDKHVNMLVREGQLKTDGARKIVNAVVREAKKEGKKIESFVMAEIKKEVKKVAPLAKKELKKAICKAKKVIKK
jgi:polyhydroxyalkanoate synthesis regulator phasin